MRLGGIQRILKELVDMTDCKAEDLANRHLMKFSKEQNYVPLDRIDPCADTDWEAGGSVPASLKMI